MTSKRLPCQSHSPTSRAAAHREEPRAGSKRAEVLAYLRQCGPAGATDEEMQAALAMNPSTQRPRRVELVEAGLVRYSGTTRLTRSGLAAAVWVAGDAPGGSTPPPPVAEPAKQLDLFND